MSSYNIDDLRSELASYSKPKKEQTRTPREERIIAGFEEIEHFIEKHKRPPQHGEDKDIFERLYAVRLDKIRSSEDCLAILKDSDKYGVLDGDSLVGDMSTFDTDSLLSELSDISNTANDITRLTHVTSREERRTAEEIAQRTLCNDFEKFKNLFLALKENLKSGDHKATVLTRTPEIKKECIYILFGQIAYVADFGKTFISPQGRTDARLRLIFDNGTESNMLLTSLQRALLKDSASREIGPLTLGPLFSDQRDESDIESGLIYVLRSKSEHPVIKDNQNILHKIGVTGGNVDSRIKNAKNDPTFLMADVEIVSTYRLSNINRVRLEGLIHKFFSPAKFGIAIKDRFGKTIEPREWYLVPLFIIDEAVEMIKSGKILNSKYDVSQGKIIEDTTE